MCWEMAAGIHDQEAESEKHLRKQLAAIVKSIQWSYAIFWSASSCQPGVLEWKFGYYNGDIKTRKTTQGMELKADRWGLQRSEQLRDLYLSLSAGDNNPHARRPSASLCPEDLTDLEWYYLVCMSFTFSHGQSLPGRTLSSGNHVWLCNAHYSDSKIFSRSLLAKSAAIQTVACFPLVDGVLEIGTTETVLEDLHLIKHVMDFHKCTFPEASLSMQNVDEDENQDPHTNQETPNGFLDNLNHDDGSPSSKGSDLRYSPVNSYVPEKCTITVEDRSDRHVQEELETESPDCCSNDCCPHQHIDDSLISEGVNCTSQVRHLQFIDDEFNNSLHLSFRSNRRPPEFMAAPQWIINSAEEIKLNQHVGKLQECKNSFSSLDVESDDSHYRRTLSAIFKAQNQSAVSCHLNGLGTSSFTIWEKDPDVAMKYSGMPQRMLKNILLNVALMHSQGPEKAKEETGASKIGKTTVHPIPDQISSERREKLNEKFLALRSLVPSVGMAEQTSILGDAIKYLRELERRIEELETSKELISYKTRIKKSHPDVSERTSDNYGNNRTGVNSKSGLNKRKAHDMDETEYESRNLSTNGTDVSVTILEKEVAIQMQCPWRECLLLEIMDAISNFKLDAYSVQSSMTDGVLSLSVKSKFRGAVLASPGMIKQAICRVLGTGFSP